eukprot:XP_014043032.1 PREDICTED: sodium bicarbonate cotransporter 3-like [Salmo salar]
MFSACPNNCRMSLTRSITGGGLDEEAIVDLGKTSSTTHTNYETEELESHRAVYVGVHVPLGRESKRRHHRRGHKHHRKRREREEDHEEEDREDPTYGNQLLP